jgi:hypothetical protein
MTSTSDLRRTLLWSRSGRIPEEQNPVELAAAEKMDRAWRRPALILGLYSGLILSVPAGVFTESYLPLGVAAIAWGRCYWLPIFSTESSEDKETVLSACSTRAVVRFDNQNLIFVAGDVLKMKAGCEQEGWRKTSRKMKLSKFRSCFGSFINAGTSN